jgi:hypothetical protein
MDDLAALIDEPGSGRDLGPPDREDGVGVAIVDARIRDRELSQEVLGGSSVVLDVDAEKSDFVGVRLGGLSEEGKLRSARRGTTSPTG